MDVISEEAVGALTALLEGRLPSPADPALRPLLTVAPASARPAGIGGFVGMSDDPFGQISGRRVRARAHVTARASDHAGVPTAIADVVRALVAAERTPDGGYLRVALDDLGPPDPSAPQREAIFDVDFEFLKEPEAPEGVIGDIPLDLDVDETGRSRILLDIPFMEPAFGWFEIVDDPRANRNRPSQWRYDPPARSIDQLASIWGGSPGSGPNKPGTYAVLTAAPARPPIADFVLRTTLRSGSGRGVGVVFRWVDVDNFYYFLMDANAAFRRLGRRVGGTFGDLETPAAASAGYDPAETYRVKVRASGDELAVFLNEVPILSGRDSALAGPGRIGLMCHRNNDAHFYSLQVREA